MNWHPKQQQGILSQGTSAFKSRENPQKMQVHEEIENTGTAPGIHSHLFH